MRWLGHVEEEDVVIRKEETEIESDTITKGHGRDGTERRSTKTKNLKKGNLMHQCSPNLENANLDFSRVTLQMGG